MKPPHTRIEFFCPACRDNVFKQLADEAAKGRLPGNILHLVCEAYEAAVRVGQRLAKARDEAEGIRRVR